MGNITLLKWVRQFHMILSALVCFQKSVIVLQLRIHALRFSLTRVRMAGPATERALLGTSHAHAQTDMKGTAATVLIKS